MNLETLFWLSNLLIIPFWVLMLILPNWSWTKRIIASPLIILPIALAYVMLLIPNIGSIFEAYANPTLSTFIESISRPENAVLTYQHLAAFDLLAGRWVYMDGYERQINRWVMTLVLFLTVATGPLGFVAYLGIRYFTKSKV